MTNMISENDIIDSLYSLLSEVSNVEVVYKGIPQVPEEFPAITIQPNTWEDSFADSRDTEVLMTFYITIYIQLVSSDEDETTITAQDTLRDIVLEVREVLGDKDNITLGGLIDSSRLTQGQYMFDQKESKLGFCQLTYKVRKRFNRY
jgi:hypothetical protein